MVGSDEGFGFGDRGEDGKTVRNIRDKTGKHFNEEEHAIMRCVYGKAMIEEGSLPSEEFNPQTETELGCLVETCRKRRVKRQLATNAVSVTDLARQRRGRIGRQKRKAINVLLTYIFALDFRRNYYICHYCFQL